MLKSFWNHCSPFTERYIFYGWWIAIGSMAILTMTSGIGFFGHTLILDPLRMEFGWSKGTVSSAVTLFFLVGAVAGSIIGGQIDKYGSSPVLVFGSFCLGLGFILLARIQNLWELYAVYFILAIGWSGAHAVPVSSLIARWFVRKRGLAMSVAMTGLSLGGVIVVPVASYLLERFGLRGALPLYGFALWAVIIPIALFLLKSSPAVMGIYTDGDLPPSHDKEGPETTPGISSQMTSWTRRQAMSTKAFWAIVLAFFLVFSGQITFMIHEISFLSPFLGSTGAAFAVSLMTGSSFCGRLIVGSFVDRLNLRGVAVICFLLQAGAVLTIAHCSRSVPLYFCVVAFGLTMGNIIMIQSLLIGECFGMISFGSVSGLVMLFTSSGSAFGPMLAGILFDITKSYRPVFSLFALSYTLASGVVIFANPPQRTQATQR